MGKATKIKMKSGCETSFRVSEIESIYVVGELIAEGWYSTQFLYHFVKHIPGSIQVNVPPFPNLQANVGPKGEKGVISKMGQSKRDKLMSLPRCR